MRARSAGIACVVLLLGSVPAGASAKPFFVEPDDSPDPRGLTLAGHGLARVEPPRRLNEASIDRAVDRASPAALARAVRDARSRARALAPAAGLTLGEAQSIRTRVPDMERYGVAKHCYPVRARAGHRGKRRRCAVPAFATTTVGVTFATLETSGFVADERGIVASGSGHALVRPRLETSPSIRAALRRARPSADRSALAAALRSSAAAARASGLRPGPLFSIAEEPPLPFSLSIVVGSFGPGHHCATSRRRRGPRVRCQVPEMTSVLRVTRPAG